MDCPKESINDVINISGEGNKKKPKDFINKSILPAVCALLNSDGGTINITEIELDDRSIEQAVTSIIGETATSTWVKVQNIGEKDLKTIIYVKKCNQFITVSYNLCVPTQKQIIAVAAGDNQDNIRSMLKQGIVENCVCKGSHIKHFVQGKSSGLDESDDIQLKHLKAEASNSAKTTFGKRVVTAKNKFSSYVSGFANHRGGHIYYGIDDESRVVFGEKLMEEDIKAVESEVTKAMKKLVWTERKISPKRGDVWEIYFVNVKNENGEIVDSTYVVVVFVAFCRGGVFTAEPESYYIEDRKVKRMDFYSWWKSFMSGAFSTYYFIKPKNMDSVSWSSKDNKKLFIQLSERLVDHRDAGDFDGFDKLCKLAEEHFKGKNGHLVVMAGRVTIAYKSGNAQQAQTLLQQFSELIDESKVDKSIFQVRLFLSQSLVARSLENYKESYEKSKEGLQLGQNIPPGLCLLWLYLECAMNAISLAFQNQHDVKRFGELRREALVYLEETARVATCLTEDSIQYRITDFQHKLSIYKAWVLLNYSVTGEAAKIAPTLEELDVASAELCSVYKNQLNGNSLTKFREIEFHLAKSDHFTRVSETKQDKMKKKKMLEDAKNEASTAETLAGENVLKNNFKKLSEYAMKRVKVLKERIELCKDTPTTRTVRTFEGLVY